MQAVQVYSWDIHGMIEKTLAYSWGILKNMQKDFSYSWQIMNYFVGKVFYSFGLNKRKTKFYRDSDNIFRYKRKG